ncbi:AAA family ATPase [Candidatus Tisiphia endosymbiont of Hybos culiciformis]|uniref:AAA family ATPase n=1 Tax=Candidatus Tisiphia endosymbiont of Hybos culiciformis TaxID=3139331 RepID=UPI003CCA8A3C
MAVKTPNVITEKSKVVQGNKLPRMRVGTDDFKTLLLNSDVFVDKSLMVKELLEDSGDVILIARPRRWGKSLNMNMLQKFFEIEVDERGEVLPEKDRVNNKLFIGGEIDLGLASGKKRTLKKLQIAQYLEIISDYQGQFPVIFISFKDVKGSSYQIIENGVRNQIIKLFINHRYLKHYITRNADLLDEVQQEKLERYFTGKIDTEDLKDSLRFLSEVLYKHFNQKVYILIDEYDTPINSAYLKFGDRLKEFEDVLEMFRGMFGSSLKGNPCLEKGVITGILRIAKANLFSDLNNVSEYTLLDKKFAKFYGFTQGEVDELLTKVPLETNPEKIKDWYNGYNFGGEIIYNPWSIMQCLAHEGALDHYWLDSGGTGLIDKALLSDKIQEDLQSLLEGKGIVKRLYTKISLGEIEDDPNIFYSLLLFAGYLNPLLADDNPEDPTYRLTIPNKEVRNIYITRVRKWVTNKLNIEINEYDNFIKLLITQQISQFGEKLQEYLLKSTSYHDLLVERDYHNLMGGILAPLTVQYVIESNRESGYGRCDHMLVPIVGRGDSAIIVEYKICKIPEELESVAKIGLKQIINKQYDAKIKEHVHIKKITKIAIAFCGKEVALEYRVDEL